MFCVYLLASQPFGTLYTGMTDDLVRRVWEHKSRAVPGFTAKYHVIEWCGLSRTRVVRPRGCTSGKSRNGGGPEKSI
jgi:putative endonuclease